MNFYFAKFYFKKAIDHLQSFRVFSALTWCSNYEILEWSRLPNDSPIGSKDTPLHMYLNQIYSQRL